MISLLLQSSFIGFLVVSFIMIVIRFYVKDWNKYINTSLDVAVLNVTRIAGIVFVFYWIFSFYIIIHEHEYLKGFILYRLWGKYSFDNWIYIIICVFCVTLLNFAVVQKSYGIRMILAIGLIYSLEPLIMLLTSFHRFTIYNKWVIRYYNLTGNLFYNWGINLVIFMCMIGVAYWVKKLRNR